MRRISEVFLATALAIGAVGCKSIPSADTLYMVSDAIGVAAGLVANQTKIDDEARNATIDIMNIVADCVPASNETFVAAWTPIARAHTDKLIAEGKIDAAQGQLIMVAFNAAATGLDYVFYRYPTAKQYEELTVAAIDGFLAGFLTVFKPANEVAKEIGIVYDEPAYEFIKARSGN